LHPIAIGLLKELIEAGYRQLALKYHPDRAGGDVGIMQRVNLLIEMVRHQLR
jgi:curved DNA-binding protein CbpA